MTANNFNRVGKTEYKLPSGLTIQQLEEQSKNTVEEIFIKAFAAGHPRFYEDERCGNNEMIRANADGSEDLVSLELPSRNVILISSLQPEGKGKYAYLLQDERFIVLKGKGEQ